MDLLIHLQILGNLKNLEQRRPEKDTPAVSLTTVNDGTTWSSNVTGNIYGGSAANVFDSDQTDRAEINSTDANTNHFTVSSINSRAHQLAFMYHTRVVILKFQSMML